MAERYTRVYTQQGQFYCPGAPIIIEAGALLKDNQTGKIIAQLKFKNISSSTIRALTVKISATDVVGAEVAGVDNFQYLDLNVGRDGEFGQQTPIVLPDATARSFTCQCLSAVLGDKTIWNCIENTKWVPLPKPCALASKMGAPLAEQYKRDTTSKAQYIPVEHDGLWSCACGALNHANEQVCHSCRGSKVSLFGALNIEKLQANKKKHDDVIAAEKAAVAEAERIRAAKNKKIAIIAAVALVLLIGISVLTSEVIMPAVKYNNAISMMDEGKYEDAQEIFLKLEDYKDSPEKSTECEWRNGIAMYMGGDKESAVQLFNRLAENTHEYPYYVYSELGEYCYQSATVYVEQEKYSLALDILSDRFAAIHKDDISELVYASAKQCMVQGEFAKAAVTFGKLGDFKDSNELSRILWEKTAARDVIGVGLHHTVGLKSNGSVAAVGNNFGGACDVDNWKDIIAVSIGDYHSVGLKSDGTVIAAGDNRYGQCNVDEWSDIVAISAGAYHTVGLKKDGTLITTEGNGHSQSNVYSWTDVIAVSAGTDYTIGLRVDGTLIAVGSNHYGQCDVDEWSDIVSISAATNHTVGLRADGTVIAAGDNRYGQCDVSAWTDVIAVSAAGSHTIGLKKDGTIIITGYINANEKILSEWKNIVAISTGEYHTIGLTTDNTVIAEGNNKNGQCDVDYWTEINMPESSG